MSVMSISVSNFILFSGSQRCLECCMNATGINTCQPLLSNGDVIQYPDGVFCDTGFCFDVCSHNGKPELTCNSYNTPSRALSCIHTK